MNIAFMTGQAHVRKIESLFGDVQISYDSEVFYEVHESECGQSCVNVLRLFSLLF